ALCLGPAPAGPLRDRIGQPAPSLGPVAYAHDGALLFRPDSLDECRQLLAEHTGAQLIAGGTDLVVEANLRDRRFPALISIEALGELRVFRDGLDAVT